MWAESTFTLPDFHDDFHGSALAHASLAVLQALDCPIGGGWSTVEGLGGGGEDEEKEDGVTELKRKEGNGGLREGISREEEKRRWDNG